MKNLIAALTLVILSQTVMASEWYLVMTTKDVFFFVDKSSLVKNGAQVKFWEWDVRNSPTGNPAYDNSKVLQIANCRDRTIIIEQYQFRKGEEPVNGGRPKEQTIQAVIPDTVGESIYKTVCSGKFTGSPIPKVSVEEIQTLMAYVYSEQPKQ